MGKPPLGIPNGDLPSSSPSSKKSTSTNKPPATDLKTSLSESKTPLFLQFKMLSLMKTEARRNFTNLDVAPEPPQPVAEMELDYELDGADVKSLDEFCKLINDAETLLKSKDIENFDYAGKRLSTLQGVNITPEMNEGMPKESLNRISELCARFLTVKDYSEFYSDFVACICLQINLTADFGVFDKYNVGRHLHKLINTQPSTGIICDSLDMMYERYAEQNIEPLLKFMIAAASQVKYIHKDHIEWVAELYEIVIFHYFDFESELWIDLRSQMKHLEPEFDLSKVYLAHCGLMRRYKSWKNWFQRREFDITVEMMISNNGYHDFSKFLRTLIRDAPEKVFDPLLAAKAAASVDFSENIEFEESDLEIMIDSIAWLFPPLGKKETKFRRRPEVFSRGEIKPPTSLAHAAVIFEYYMRTLVRLFNLDSTPPKRIYINTFHVCSYMMLNHRKHFVKIARWYNLFKLVNKFVEKINLNMTDFVEPCSLLMLTYIPEMLEGDEPDLALIFRKGSACVKAGISQTHPSIIKKHLEVIQYCNANLAFRIEPSLSPGIKNSELDGEFVPGGDGYFPNQDEFKD